MRNPEFMLLTGDVRESLRRLSAGSVHCVVTSPPYWALRDYQVDGQIGMEKTPGQYVAAMVEVFREVRRVLRDDGTIWVNMGDSYANGGRGGNPTADSSTLEGGNKSQEASIVSRRREIPHGLKHKDLVGMPWQLAFALRADGWYLRCDIIWAKPNPMPESVSDRPSKAHEYVFLLSKSERYFFDHVAVRVPYKEESLRRYESPMQNVEIQNRQPGRERERENSLILPNEHGHNLRSVWNIATQPYTEAHFATFPEKLVQPCIKAGTSERGCCAACRAPIVRVVERKRVRTRPGKESKAYDRTTGEAVDESAAASADGNGKVEKPWREQVEIGNRDPGRHVTEFETAGWGPSCTCVTGEPVPCVVIDPFAGSGTTLAVAVGLGRDAVGCELSENYCAMARRRISRVNPLLVREVAPCEESLPHGRGSDRPKEAVA